MSRTLIASNTLKITAEPTTVLKCSLYYHFLHDLR